MIRLAKLLSTVLGIGYLVPKGAGTLAAAAGCGIWYWVQPADPVWTGVLILVLFFAGVWASAVCERCWGKDPNRIVVDELLGMFVSLYLLPLTWKYLLASFLFFRFFDIAKPLYIRRLEHYPSGWGVMSDDLLAGIYANLLLQGAAALNLF